MITTNQIAAEKYRQLCLKAAGQICAGQHTNLVVVLFAMSDSSERGRSFPSIEVLRTLTVEEREEVGWLLHYIVCVPETPAEFDRCFNCVPEWRWIYNGV